MWVKQCHKPSPSHQHFLVGGKTHVKTTIPSHHIPSVLQTCHVPPGFVGLGVEHHGASSVVVLPHGEVDVGRFIIFPHHANKK